MFTRTTTVDGSAEAIDRGIAHVRDTVLPRVRQMPGCVGMALVVDRGTGRSIVTAAWDTQQALDDSREQVKALREQAMEILGGEARVEEWEVAVMHRKHQTHDGSCVRVTRFQADPARLDDAIEVYRTGAMPVMDDLDGFCSASLMVNRDTGMCVSSAAYADRAAMERTREQVRGLRDRVASEASARMLDVEEYELALAHLDMPEMA